VKLSDIKANPWIQPHVPDMYEGVGEGPYPAPGTFIDHAAEAAMAKVTQVMIDDVPHEVFAAIMAVSKENAALRREVKRLWDYDTRLTAVMPPDYKDWHENSKTEWPLVAALTIQNLREREDWALNALREAQAKVERLERVRNAARAVFNAANSATREAALQSLRATLGEA